MLDAVAGCGEAVYAGASRLPGDCGVMVRIAARDGGALVPALEAGARAGHGVLLQGLPAAASGFTGFMASISACTRS